MMQFRLVQGPTGIACEAPLAPHSRGEAHIVHRAPMGYPPLTPHAALALLMEDAEAVARKAHTRIVAVEVGPGMLVELEDVRAALREGLPVAHLAY